MRNYVIINGVNSLTIRGLAINNLPPITKPMIRTKREEIDGRDGDIVTELGYSAYDKSMEIGLYGNFDIDEIIKYFTGEGTIVFSNEADKYYNFKILDQIDYEKLLKFKTATITFHCQPFKYPVEETPIEGEAITITGSGSSITLENTIVAPMEVKVKGNTIQNGTPTPDSPVPVQVVSGDNSIVVSNSDNTESTSYPISLGSQNLLPVSTLTTQLKNGIIFTNNQDGSYSFNGTATAYTTFVISNSLTFNGNYTYVLKDTATTGLQMYLQRTGGIGVGGSQTHVTLNDNIKIMLIGIDNGTTLNNVVIRPYVYSGNYDSSKTYTPHRESIELCKIGTYQDKIDKSTGTNLFNKNTVTDSAWLTENGTLSTGHSGYYVSDFIPVKPNTAYYKLNSGSVRNKYYDKNKQPLNTTTYQDIDIGGVPGTFTTAQNCYYIRITFTSNGTTTLDNFMINVGETALPYEPYGTNWYLKKEIGKVVLNGSETWEEWSTNVFYPSTKYSNIKKSLSNNFTFNEEKTTALSLNNGEYCLNNSNFFLFKNTSSSTVADFKTWLSTHNTEVYYVLATPTYETITDTTLIGQLEALKPYSYNPVTNITQINNDAPFELDVSLSYTNTMNVNNVGNIYAKPILTIEGSGTIGIILNDIEVLSVDLGTDEKITIDVPNLQAYNPDNDVLLNRNVTGDYMKLLINDGDNTIAFSGSVTSATLTNYTRYI